MKNNYLIRQFTKDAVETMLSWRYAPPYSRYNMGSEDSLADEIAFFTDATNGYYAIWQGDELIGHCCFGYDAQVPGGDYSTPALDMGVGMRPDLTGKRLGSTHLQAVLAFALATYPHDTLRATIAAFNVRAQKAAMSIGFQPIATFSATTNGETFVVLVRPRVLPTA